MKTILSVVVLSFLLSGCTRLAQQPDQTAKKTNTYFVAADEVDWNYTPSGIDQMMGMEFMGYAKIVTERGPHRIGTTYKKALYREYTDDTFTKVKPRPAGQEYLGALGPVLRGEVGDTIRVVFKNNGTHPYTMHPHGVFYKKDSEGAPYADGTSGQEKNDDGVPPGQTHVYTWEVPERAGPGPQDPSSLVWLYHSHAQDMKDVDAGLIGTIIITRRGMSGLDGKPKDVDKEFVNLFMIYDENDSWFLDENIQRFTTDPKGVKKSEAGPPFVDESGTTQVGLGTGFIVSNIKATINGFMFSNMPLMTMKKGERVRWYLVTVGQGFNFHTPHWHGNVVMQAGRRTDVISIAPAQMETVDMVPDDPGTWMYHCHISEHMHQGMVANYKVEP